MKTYTVFFQLWDVSSGARAGELVEESDRQTTRPLSGVLSLFEAYVEQCPVKLDPLSLGALRVGLSRAQSGRLVIRRKFDYEGRKYMLSVHVQGPPKAWVIAVPHRQYPITVAYGAEGQLIAYVNEDGKTISLTVSPFYHD